MITIDADVSTAMRYLSPLARKNWIIELLRTISEDGEIEEIRAIVNDAKWSDK